MKGHDPIMIGILVAIAMVTVALIASAFVPSY